MNKIKKEDYETEKLSLRSEINHFNLDIMLGMHKEKEEWKIHNTNLKKLDILLKQETKEWKKKWLR